MTGRWRTACTCARTCAAWGVGKGIVAELLGRAEAAGFRQMLALIGDSDNIGSIGMHASLGFQRAGVMRACGVKFGRWLDVVIMQRGLGVGGWGCAGEEVSKTFFFEKKKQKTFVPPVARARGLVLSGAYRQD